MSKSDSDHGTPRTDDEATGATRIDTAHVLIEEQSPPVDARIRRTQPADAVAAASPAVAGIEGSESPAGQLRLQAAELADYLRRRQNDLDRRQSQLNAQLAQVEQESRAARMSLAEREAELDQQRQQLEARLAQRAAELERRHQQLEARQAKQEAEWDQRRQQLEARLAERAAEWDQRRQQLEARLAEQAAECDQRRQQLEAEQAAEWGQRQQQLEAEQAAEWGQRQQELEARQAALEAAKAEQDRAEAEARRAWAKREEELRAAEHRLGKGSMALARRKEALAEREKQLKASAVQDRKSIEADLATRLEALARGEEDLEAAVARHKKAEQALAKKSGKDEESFRSQRQRIDSRREASEQLIRQMLNGLERRRQAVEAHGAKLAEKATQPGPELLRREARAQEATRGLEAKQRALDEAEATLASSRAELDELRAQVTEDRRQLREQARTERQRMAAEHRRALAELEKKRQSLARRSEHVDQCRLALEQTRSELGRMHQEMLEVRLATEELWVQLSESAPPDALQTSLEQIQARLAEHRRAADAELAQRREELNGLRSQLAEEYRKLLGNKEEFELWAARRQQQIEQQAQRLIAREQELDRRETVFNDLARQWQSEQLGLRQEVRRLKTRLGEPLAAAASG